MANLGSDNTPIEGESFGLPSGYAVDEENGDLVIRDTDGTVVMRRADGAAWQLEGSDISGVGAFDSESVNTERATSNNITLTKNNIGDVTRHTGRDVPMGDTFEDVEIFSSVEPVDVVGGHINGDGELSHITVTWDDDTTADLDGQEKTSGSLLNGEKFSVYTIPPLRNVKSLSCRSQGTDNSEYGWQVMTV